MEQLIKEINSLGIKNLTVSEMYEGKGSFVNQVEKQDSERCYGIVADEDYLLVCEYGCEGCNPEIIIYKKRNV